MDLPYSTGTVPSGWTQMAIDLIFKNEYAGDHNKILCDAAIQVQGLIFLSPTLWEALLLPYWTLLSMCPDQ